jgi:O-antigen ligase
MFIGVVLAIPVFLNFVIFKDAGDVEEVLSMTGRIPFWTALLNDGIVKEPFFGYGFMRINYTDYFVSLNTYAAKMTHNTFMQVLMNLGFVGLFIVFWQLVLTLRNFFKERQTSLYGHFFIALFIPIFINSLTEFGIFGEANYGILFYQFLILLFSIQIRESRSKKETLLFNLFQKRWKLDSKLS